MIGVESEKPGGQTPWLDINQLLALDKRFEFSSSNWKGFLLAPKQSAQLAALLYILYQREIPFCVQGRETERNSPASYHLVIISIRAFSQVILHEQGIVEVGAGCSLSYLHQFLMEKNQEVLLEEGLLLSSKHLIGELILSGKTAGIQYKQERLTETILGIEFVTWEGSQIKWGGCHRSALAGPALHQLIWGLESLPGIIVKVIIKTYPIPQARLHLTWSFRKLEILKEHFHTLQYLTSTWECLEYVLSGQSTDQGFIFAQLSGLREEMEAFSQFCPCYSLARQQGEREQLKFFLKQKQLRAYAVTQEQSLKPGEYLWSQECNNKKWWLTSQVLEKQVSLQPLWKEKFWKGFCQVQEA